MATSEARYIFVTGGVTSSLGKGIISASLAKLFQSSGFRVTAINLGIYLNVDQSTINPYECGECYITANGAEVDLDLGHYERFLDEPTTGDNNITSGKIYQNVITRERKGEYLGKVVQVVPHLIDEIKRSILNFGTQHKYDVVVVEIGGIVGDIESLPYIEAIRQLKWELGHRVVFVHLTLVPYLSAFNQLKTKPTQHSVKALLETGIQPDVLMLRTEHELSSEQCQNVARSCNVDSEAVVQMPYLPYIYEIPLRLQEQHLDSLLLHKLKLETPQKVNLSDWKSLIDNYKQAQLKVKVAVVGNYVEQPESYKSITESIKIAAMHKCIATDICLIHSENISEINILEKFKAINAIVIASDNGSRGVDGKVITCKYARENNLPILMIGTAMQIAVDEFRSNICGKEKLSAYVNQLPKCLGNHEYDIQPETKCFAIYNSETITERSRFDCNIDSTEFADCENFGMKISATDKESGRVAMIELPSHKFYVGCSFRPEYNNSFNNIHPLFASLINELKIE